MARLNSVIFQGKIFRIGELKKTKAGKPVTTIRMRQSYPKGQTHSGDPDWHSDWIDVECWNKTAEIAHESLNPDDYVTVEGRLKYEEWKDRETGKTRSKHVIVASFLHRMPGSYTDAVSNKVPTTDWADNTKDDAQRRANADFVDFPASKD